MHKKVEEETTLELLSLPKKFEEALKSQENSQSSFEVRKFP